MGLTVGFSCEGIEKHNVLEYFIFGIRAIINRVMV